MGPGIWLDLTWQSLLGQPFGMGWKLTRNEFTCTTMVLKIELLESDSWFCLRGSRFGPHEVEE